MGALVDVERLRILLLSLFSGLLLRAVPLDYSKHSCSVLEIICDGNGCLLLAAS